MTPAARVAAAIDLLDTIIAGTPAERALTNWARGNRFAGSKDRAAIRDLVFDGLRRKRSSAARSGGTGGRGIMIGLLLERGDDLEDIFTGARYAPSPLTSEEATTCKAARQGTLPDPVALDYPDWLDDALRASLGDDFAASMTSLRGRAPVVLRANLLKMTRAEAQVRLADEGVETRPHPASPTALEVEGAPRGLRQIPAFQDGWVELQDAASQAVADFAAERAQGPRILDYCAGGGGKALALAALTGNEIVAHDADPRRMSDIPGRAGRAGAKIACRAARDLTPEAFDLVLVDAPCSGSGAWRRQPDAKWRLTPDKLADLTRLQRDILAEASRYVRPGGDLIYATCSLLRTENEDQIAQFLVAQTGWDLGDTRNWRPHAGTDGFFAAHLKRS